MERDWGILCAKDNAYMVRCAVIGELDMHATACERCAIKFNRRHAVRNSVWVLDLYIVARRVIAECDVKAPPCTWDTRIEIKSCAPQPKTEDPFDAGAIHPTR